MEQDYQELEIDPNCSLLELKKRYVRLCLQWHPDKNPDNPEACAKFIRITAAYQRILQRLEQPGETAESSSSQFHMSTEDARHIYQNTVRNQNVGYNVEDAFSDFQTVNPAAPEATNQVHTENLRSVFQSTNVFERIQVLKPSEHKLNITLADIYQGNVLPTHWTRMTQDPHNPHNAIPSADLFRFPALHNIQEGDKFVLPGMGDYDETLNRVPDLTFVVHIEPHSCFFRDAEDLIYIIPHDRKTAIFPLSLTVPALDETSAQPLHTLVLNEDQDCYVVPNKGFPTRSAQSSPYYLDRVMPYFSLKVRPARAKRGNLMIRWTLPEPTEEESEEANLS